MFSAEYSIAFLHIPSHKEINYNEMADNFANKAADIPPPRRLRAFNFREVIRARTKIASQRFGHPPFKSKALICSTINQKLELFQLILIILNGESTTHPYAEIAIRLWKMHNMFSLNATQGIKIRGD